MIAPIEVAETSIVLMSQDEARRAVETIKTNLDSTRRILFDLYEREGWRALGYPSWRDCAQAEFGQSVGYLYRQLSAAKIERDLDSPIGEIPESHLRAAAKAAPVVRPAVIARADEIAGDRPRTARHIEQAAAEIRAPDLPIDFAIVRRRLAAHDVTLSHKAGVYTLVDRGGATSTTRVWEQVRDRLSLLEDAPDPDPAAPAFRMTCPTCGEVIVNGVWGDRQECGSCYHARVATSAPAIDAPERGPASATVSAYEQQEARDSDRLLRARTLIGAGDYDAARAVLIQIEVTTWERDKLLTTIPTGRQITLGFTDDDCAALLKEARFFANSSNLTKTLPTIGQALVLIVQAIKGAA